MKKLLKTFSVFAAFLLINISCKKTPEITSVTDADGNIYKIVTIGTQVWMQENLKTTKLNNNTSIPTVTANANWANLQSPGLCFLNNDETANKDTYGALYNWYTVNTGLLCPEGWHVPSNDEVNTLVTYLEGPSKAWLKLMEAGPVHWSQFPNPATNASGFTALPGKRRLYDGSFIGVPEGASWWISNVNTNVSGFSWYIVNGAAVGFDNYALKQYGLSVRCLKN